MHLACSVYRYIYVCVHNVIMHLNHVHAQYYYMHMNVVHPCTPPLVIGLVHKLHNEAEAVTFENLRIIVYQDIAYVHTRFCGPTCIHMYIAKCHACTCIFLQMGTELQLSPYTVTFITFEDVWLQ